MQGIRLNPHTDSVWHRTVKGTVLSMSPGIKVPDDPEISPVALRSPIPDGSRFAGFKGNPATSIFRADHRGGCHK